MWFGLLVAALALYAIVVAGVASLRTSLPAFCAVGVGLLFMAVRERRVERQPHRRRPGDADPDGAEADFAARVERMLRHIEAEKEAVTKRRPSSGA